MENKRPTGHGKKVGSGSAHVEKGEKVSSRPVGTGSGRTGSFDQRPGENRDGERSTAGKLGLLALLLVLPKKYRRILLIVIAVVAVLGMLGKCGGAFSGSDVSYYPETNQLSQATDAPYYTYAPVVTEAPVYTEAPVITPAPVVTEAPVVTAAPVVGEARAKRVVPKGNGKDTVTVMIYMCGTDLESKYGMGTSDLGEMVKATISDKVNVIVETGGCRAWKNNIVSSSVNQIYQVQTGGLRRLESDFGKSYMTDPDNLASFIQYCTKNFPADRNILIFWDHGGGSLSGYGYDEKQGSGFGVSADTMTLPEIKAALQKGGCVFDWIGFDACLMATLETAMVCNDYADYMIASEESEPGTGWYYTDWLTQLSKNTSVSTESIGKTIVDTFVTASQRAQANAQVTLSVVDLAKMSGTVPQALRNFSAATTNLIKGNNYKQVADARANARQFARQSRINQVDMIDLCERIGTAESKTLAAALKGCVAYNKSTMTRAYGVSVYFPYETLNGVKNAINTYNNLGIDSEYTKCIQSFASVGQGGQFASSASQQGYGSYSSGGDLLSTLLGGFMDSSSYGGSGSSYGSSGSGYGSSPYGSSSPLGSLLGDYTTSAGSGSYSAGNSVDASTIYDLLNAFSGGSMPAALDWVDTDLVASKGRGMGSHRDRRRERVCGRREGLHRPGVRQLSRVRSGQRPHPGLRRHLALRGRPPGSLLHDGGGGGRHLRPHSRQDHPERGGDADEHHGVHRPGRRRRGPGRRSPLCRGDRDPGQGQHPPGEGRQDPAPLRLLHLRQRLRGQLHPGQGFHRRQQPDGGVSGLGQHRAYGQLPPHRRVR